MGDPVGPKDGLLEGDPVDGLLEGDPVGVPVGDRVVSLGLAEGPLEGDAVGVTVGDLEGAELTVGFAVGELLG